MSGSKSVLIAVLLVLGVGMASATDLNNINKINPDSDGKVIFGGFIDMNSNRISELGTPSDADDAAPRSWINNNDDTIPDTTIPDDQALSVNNDGGTGTNDIISLDNGGNVEVNDDFQLDTTIPDDQNVQVSSTGDTISVSIDNGNGGSATIVDDTVPDDQSLSVTNDGGAGTNDIVSLNNGGSVEINDDFQTNTDNQNINSFSATGDTVSLDLESGGSSSATINDNTIPDDQNVGVSASGNTVSVSIDNGNGGSATIAQNSFQIPVGTNAY